MSLVTSTPKMDKPNYITTRRKRCKKLRGNDAQNDKSW